MVQVSLREILALSVSEREDLAQDIWDSVAAEPDTLPVLDSQKRALDDRMAAHHADPDAARPWDELKQRLQDPT